MEGVDELENRRTAESRRGSGQIRRLRSFVRDPREGQAALAVHSAGEQARPRLAALVSRAGREDWQQESPRSLTHWTVALLGSRQLIGPGDIPGEVPSWEGRNWRLM